MAKTKYPEAGAAPVISSGIFRGMKLATPSGQATRPTGGKARAAALNSLHGRLEGAVFCDLFAGSGAIGIEALSRGAASCAFVESTPSAIGALRRNLAECERRSLAQGQPPSVVQVVARDVRKIMAESNSGPNLSASQWNNSKFDIIWADPPYALAADLLPELLGFADAILENGGILMIETGAAVDHEIMAGKVSLTFKSEKKYGGTFITSWQKKAHGS